MDIEFIKMNGCNNDFLVIDLRQGIQKNYFTASRIKQLSNYKNSIGFDQLLLIDSSSKADISLYIYNNDGIEVEACGNGTRCVSSLFLHNSLSIETSNRILTSEIIDGLVTVNMGKPLLNLKEVKFDFLVGFFVDVGNPHIVIDLTSYSDLEIEEIFNKYGPLIENDYRFPHKINVNFVKVIDSNTVNLNTWERGAGATLACGTGACASFALLNAKKIVNNTALIRQKGGNLRISTENGDILMAGDAKISYRGTIRINE